MSVFEKFKGIMGMPEDDDYGMEDADYGNDHPSGYYEDAQGYSSETSDSTKPRGNKVMNVSSTMQL
ncbi:MAG: cell division protein SepF, partial [Ruthenibacterium sp.]